MRVIGRVESCPQRLGYSIHFYFYFIFVKKNSISVMSEPIVYLWRRIPIVFDCAYCPRLFPFVWVGGGAGGVVGGTFDFTIWTTTNTCLLSLHCYPHYCPPPLQFNQIIEILSSDCFWFCYLCVHLIFTGSIWF